jgi:hypothetical protein
MSEDTLKVNFSDEEAGSEARDFEALPTGKYHVTIFDGELKESQSQKNPGKPFWSLTLQIQDGKYEGRRLWANVMLFEGALYSLAQLLKAIGRDDALKSGKVPAIDELLGKDCVVTAAKVLDSYKMEKDGIDPKTAGPDERIYKTEVKGFKAWDGAPVGTMSSGSTSMLP